MELANRRRRTLTEFQSLTMIVWRGGKMQEISDVGVRLPKQSEGVPSMFSIGLAQMPDF